MCDSGEIDCETNPFAGVVAIAAGGDHSVALGMDGRVWAWGANDSNQLGDGTTNPATSPQPVCNVGASNCAADPLDDVVHIVAGTGFSAALRSDGSVVAWGSNANGELGDGSTTQRATPVKVCAPGETAPCQAFLSDVVVLAAGGSHSLAITESGELYGWGNNEAGQVGVGDTSTAEVAIPRRVCASGMTSPCSSFFVGAVSIDAWAEHSLVSDESGVLWAFGSNAENELGAASTDTCANLQTCNSSPKPVCMAAETSCTTPLDGVSSFGAGRYFSIALRSDGSLLAWGDNRHGQLGNDSTDPSETPTAVCNVSASAPCENSPAALVEAATAGSFQTFALRSDGSVLVWGSNTSGQVGNASPGTDALTPLILSL